ncbi:MAG: hypothetical protein JNK82_28280 [Myxococcaceae bacterium]|nr:hypothetical protein [Myxococcaceae bacterium]
MGTRAANRKQHLGGLANFHGSTFEHLFAVWRVVRAVTAACDGLELELSLQLPNCRVDDWVEDGPRRRDHFQLRRRRKTNWSTVAKAFEWQLAQRVASKSVGVILVVQSAVEARRLAHSPGRVRGARVDWFPSATRPRELLGEPRIRADLVASCIKELPTRSDIEAIWAAIDFAWWNARQPGAFVDVQRVIAALQDQNLPLRFPWQPTAEWEQAEKLLRRVRGFSFSVRDGHFLYRDGAGTSGRLSCRTTSFRKFVRLVLKQRPSDLNATRSILERA